MPDTTVNLAGAFPIIKFDTLPSGMEMSRGRSGRTIYDWGKLGLKEGILVDGMKYNSAQSSATNFAANHPFDEEQEKKLKKHLSGRVLAAKNAFKAEVEAKGETFTDEMWTEEHAAKVQPDPEWVKNNCRMFSSLAVRGDDGKITKSKGYMTGGKKPTELADQYYIIRTQ